MSLDRLEGGLGARITLRAPPPDGGRLNTALETAKKEILQRNREASEKVLADFLAGLKGGE